MSATANSNINTSQKSRPSIPSGILGILIFIITEIMFFAAFISSYLIIRAENSFWPPLDQPRLPVFVTAINTIVLILSGYFLYKSVDFFIQKTLSKSKLFFMISIILGSLFISIQGYEWIRLLNFGLTLTSSVYGSLFYLIIGSHALHVFVALLVLIHTFLKLQNVEKSGLTATDLNVVRCFWLFVVALWPVLYYLVYLY